MISKYVQTPGGQRLHRRHPEFPRTFTACGMSHLAVNLQPTPRTPSQGYPLCQRCAKGEPS